MFAAAGARVFVTTASDGDVRGAPARQRFSGPAWTSVRQVHGNRVLLVDGPGGVLEEEADALVTASNRVPLAVLGADCGLIGLVGDNGVVAAAHAGWRGLSLGVIEATVGTMGELGASHFEAVLGPCIHPECYPFGEEDLDVLVAQFGPKVAARSRTGTAAFDLPGAITGVLGALGVELVATLGGCTACSGEFYSYRARGDTARHALVVEGVAR